MSRRTVDSAILVQGDVCTDASGSAPVTATSAKVKTINIGADATSGSAVDLSKTAEIVIIDLTGGTFALGTGTGGIFVDLGGGGDAINILGSNSTDKVGCNVKSGQECLGVASTAGCDVKVTNYSGNHYTIDLSGGNDTFDKGACATPVEVYGGAGVDTLFAGTDTTTQGDHYHGGTEIDTLSYASRTQGVSLSADGSATSGDPSGSGEQDVIEADIENLIGGSGDDTLVAAADTTAKHTLSGGAGNDTLVSKPGGNTTFAGGGGIDTADYSARSHGVVVTMSDGKANDGEPADFDNVGLDVENLIGSSHDDTITGSNLSNVITPGDGNDTVTAGDGNDVIMASASVDGNDTISGGKGADTVDYSARASGVCVVLDGVTHSGSCSFSMGNAAMNVSGNDADLIGTDVENVVGTAGDDHLVGNSNVNFLFGLGGIDWLEGRAGDDQLDANSYTSANGNTCDPLTFACYGTVNGTCDCKVSSLTTSCSAAAYLDCGNDPLDIASCASATSDQFVGCWRTQ